MKNNEQKSGLSAKYPRRTMLKWGGAAVLVAAGAGFGPTLFRNRQIFRRTELLMGSFGEIQIVHDDAVKATALLDQAFAEARRIEMLMSRFQTDSDIGRINLHAQTEAVVISAETAAVLQRALHWSKVTEGRFDPAIGHLSKLWNLEDESPVPEKSQLELLASQSFFKDIKLENNSNSQTVSFLSSEMQLDLGGIAKGYAVDQVAAVLQNSGIEQALINFGGDLMALGGRDESKAWRVGIKDPNKPEKISQVLNLRNQAVATSGNYEQFRRSENGELLSHHLIDPQSARPGRLKFHGLSVIGSNCMDTDALATGLFFQDRSQAQQLLEDFTTGFSTIRLG
ncbi:MAG: FAD:protein FMN transferase [SAR324 cluster bacterium]|nr:FAD:protein FMN transferase [SAR324 cluster bacterium]